MLGKCILKCKAEYNMVAIAIQTMEAKIVIVETIIRKVLDTLMQGDCEKPREKPVRCANCLAKG